MRFSIIIPARNEESQIAATVRCALQAVEHYLDSCGTVNGANQCPTEILVVDNASSDRTPAILAEMAARWGIGVIHADQLGAPAARNQGTRHSRGEILVYVDADTHIPRTALTRINELTRQNFGAGIFCYAAQLPGLRARCWWGFWNYVRLLPLARAKAMPAFMFCTREVFDAHGPFDETVAIGEEWPILAGLYRSRRRQFIYDRSLVARTSSRRMELRLFGYTRLYIKYALAILFRPARVNYSDCIREAAPVERAKRPC